MVANGSRPKARVGKGVSRKRHKTLSWVPGHASVESVWKGDQDPKKALRAGDTAAGRTPDEVHPTTLNRRAMPGHMGPHASVQSDASPVQSTSWTTQALQGARLIKSELGQGGEPPKPGP